MSSTFGCYMLRAKCIGLTKKFIQAFPQDGMESPNKLFGQPDKLSAVCRATPWSVVTCSIGEDTCVQKSTACPEQQGLWAGLVTAFVIRLRHAGVMGKVRPEEPQV